MSEQQTPALEKAFLDMPAMVAIVRRLFDRIKEPRSRKRPTHSLTDCLVSCLAMFHFRDGSMLQFEMACKKDSRRRNLRRLFGLKGDPPSDTTMRRRLDKVDPDEVRPAFSAIWHAAEERGMLKPFDVFGGRVAVALDATQHFESTKIHCGSCLRRLIDKVMHYSHQALLAAAVSVDEKRALPLDVEPIVNGDGDRKQDCEAKAATRLLPRLREFYPSMRPVILCDALYANGPMLRRIAEHDMEFIATVKEPHSTKLFDAAFGSDDLQMAIVADPTDEECEHEFYWCEDVPINASQEDVRGTLVSWTKRRIGETRGRAKEKQRGWEQTMSWFTNMDVERDRLLDFMRLARARWRIENEAFNVLKNHGMEMEHNYGHGKRHLATVMLMLMLQSSSMDSLWGMTAPIARRARKLLGSWKSVWESLRILVRYVEVDDWQTLYAIVADERKVVVSAAGDW